jgi:ankyrin repeat protein
VSAPLVTGLTPLDFAVLNGNEKMVRSLLVTNVDVNHQAKNGAMALATAAQYGYGTIAQLLIAAGADVNQASPDGYLPAHVAAGYGNTEVMQVMIKAGVKIDQLNNDGYSPIHLVVLMDQVDTMQALLQSGVDITHLSKDGESVVFLAASNGYKKMLELLIDAGADYHKPNKYGMSPLFTAVRSDHVDVVDYLLGKLADYAVSFAANEDDVMTLAGDNAGDLMRILIDYKINHGQSREKISITPFELAVVNGKISMVNVFTDKVQDLKQLSNDLAGLYLIAVKQKNEYLTSILTQYCLVDAFASENKACKFSDRDTPMRFFQPSPQLLKKEECKYNRPLNSSH